MNREKQYKIKDRKGGRVSLCQSMSDDSDGGKSVRRALNSLSFPLSRWRLIAACIFLILSFVAMGTGRGSIILL